MIGDWVYKPKYNGDVLIYTAETVEADDLYLGRISGFKEIPLTPEILVKNGFSTNGLDVALFDRKGGDDFVGAANIQYVHELQHVLRLCGVHERLEGRLRVLQRLVQRRQRVFRIARTEGRARNAGIRACNGSSGRFLPRTRRRKLRHAGVA